MFSEPSRSKVRWWSGRGQRPHLPRWEQDGGSPGKVKVEATQFHSPNSLSVCGGSVSRGTMSCGSMNVLLKIGPEATWLQRVCTCQAHLGAHTLAFGLSRDECHFGHASITVCSFGRGEIVLYLAITLSWIIPFKKSKGVIIKPKWQFPNAEGAGRVWAVSCNFRNAVITVCFQAMILSYIEKDPCHWLNLSK